MRTLKKTLCLVLVVVMMAGLCSIGTSAAFADADKITYTQAAEVLNGLGVMKGDDNGFRPLDTITRAEACVLIVRMLGAEGMKATATSFTDLAGYGWAKDAIAYCEAEGIVAGNGDGTFNPAGKLTGYAFAKMLLCAAGLDAEFEGMIGANWEIGVAKLVKEYKLAKAISAFDGTAACTREEAAQLAFEALFNQNLVVCEYKQGTKVEGNGFSVTTDGWYDYDDNDDCMIEKYFDVEDLGTVPNGLNQPTTKYESGNKKISFTVAKTPVATFTAGVKAKDVATALEGYSLVDASDDTIKYAINNIKDDYTGAEVFATGTGVLTGDDDKLVADKTVAYALAALTANGKLVEFYADNEKNITDVVVVTYEAAKVTNIVTDKNGKITYTLTKIAGGNYTAVDYADKTADTIVAAAAPAKGDIVTVATGTNKDGQTTYYVYATSKVTGTLTALSSDKKTATVDGTKYTKGQYFAGNELATASKAANYYLDQYGYVVYTDNTAASTDYAYIVAVDGKATKSLDGMSYAFTVRAVLADGTVGEYTLALGQGTTNTDKVIKGLTGAADLDTTEDTQSDADTAVAAEVAKFDTIKTFGYTLEDGVMTLEALASADGFEKGDVVADTANVAAKATSAAAIGLTDNVALFNSATKIVAYNSTTKTATVFNGTGALPAGTTLSGANFIGKANADDAAKVSITASVVFASANIDTATGTELVYIDASKFVETKADGKTSYTYTAYNADGEKVELTAKSSDKLNTSEIGLYVFAGTTVKDGNERCLVSETTFADGADVAIYDATLAIEGDMLKYTASATETYGNITDSTKIVYVNDTLNEVNGNGGFVVFEKANGARTNNVAVIFVTVD